MEHKFIKFENGSFNATHIGSLKLDVFLKENEAHPQFANLEPDARKAKLTQLHGLCVEAIKPEAAPAIEEPGKVAPGDDPNKKK